MYFPQMFCMSAGINTTTNKNKRKVKGHRGKISKNKKQGEMLFLFCVYFLSMAIKVSLCQYSNIVK